MGEAKNSFICLFKTKKMILIKKMILLRNVHPRTKQILNNQILNCLKRQFFLGAPALLTEDGDLSQRQMDGTINNNNNNISNDINNNETKNNNMAPVRSRVKSKGLKQRK